jgi:iron complex outermembrane receptor protein
MKRTPLITFALLGLALAVQQATAASILEEVIVTAQKREQSLQDVPIAITAFTGAQMSALGITKSVDIAAFSPGVHISGNLAGQNTQFSIRGVTQNDFNDIIEAPNAVYLDEGYLAVAQAQTFAVFDIDRVEILKGPQGTLFGRNATGGLVHYLSNKPNFDENNGYVDLSMGRYDTDANANRTTVEAAYGAVLSEKVAARAAFRYNKQDGYLKNLYPEGAFAAAPGGTSPGEGAGADLGDDDTFAGRLSFAFQPSDDTRIDVSMNYATSEVGTGPYQSKSTIGIVENGELINVIDTPADETRLTIDTAGGDGGADLIDGDGLLPGGGYGFDARLAPGGDFFGYLDPDGDDFTFSSDFAFADQGSTDTKGINVRVERELGNGTVFTSVTDYKDYEKLLFIDVDSGPGNQLANYAGVDATSFTQEFRLNGETDDMRWVTGFFYLNIDNQSDNGLKAPANSLIGPLDIGVVADLQTDSYSLFGQLDYDISDTLSATFGMRVIREEKDFNVGIGFFPSLSNHTVNQGEFIPNAVGAGSPYFYENSTSDTLWAAKAQLDWRPSDDLLLYAGVNRGVKAGSFNAPLLGSYLGSGGDSAIDYGEEILLAYEGGFKMSLTENTRLNGSVFYYDYSDYQAFLFVGVGGVVINADADNIGMELELQSSPAEGLDVILSMSYFDATVKDIPLRSGSPLPPRDVDPTYAPELQMTGLVRYEWPISSGSLAIQGDISYSDEYYYNLRNFDADKFDSYVMLNSQLSWMSTDGLWQATLAVRNLTDERAGVQGFDLATLCGCNEVSYRDPRSVNIGIRREF